ncbi:PAS domain S-box protein [Leptolyngbya sp. FACHB-321]|uniref:PAS domain S-box protein n=1 Tax=Leptolyngbya sp. FACHB-321 TaxID=2692807 RepID=UPI001686249C|nr:PAS domain S-box protein [Leptolyngbya sp. FACHB-321]MBD2034925.1 PAS domain S-box protein [Leptolyngbya sp. FACHB-321]
MLSRQSHAPSPPPLAPLVTQPTLKPERPRWLRYGVALFCVLLALVLMLGLGSWMPIGSSPFLVFFAAVMVSAWYGGLGAGLCATAIAALAATYFFLPPIYVLRVSAPGDLVRLGIFVLTSLLLVSLSSTRRELVRALRHERDLITAIVSTAGSFIVVLDHWGRIIQFNRACEQLTGYTFAEVRGKYVWDLFLLVEDIEPVKQVFRNLCVNAVPSEYENYWLARDGRRRLITWSSNVLLDEWGAVSHVISTGIDITERKQVERSLQETNQELQALIQASPVAITVLDRQGIVKRWNPAAEQIFGWRANETINHVMPTVPEEKQAEFAANIAATLNGTLLDGMETYRQRKDGAFIYVGIWTAVLRGLTAEEDCVLSIVADLSARKQAEVALKLSQERLNSLVEANVIGILFGQINGDINEANDEFLRMVGYSRDDLCTGKLRWTEITPAEYLPLDEQSILTVQAGEHCVPYEKEYIRKDGSRVPVLIGFGLLGEAKQQTIAFILDLTERKQLEQTLRTQTEELAQANRMKDEFLAVLSHELRTPLNSILGWARLLRTRQFDPVTTARTLETIERNARLQNQLINDILDVSTITQGRLRLQPQPVDLATVVTAAIDTMRPAAVAKSITVTWLQDAPLETMPLMVLGDPDRLQQAVWNLLANAIKFTPEGGRVDVKLQAARSTPHLSHAHISVTDTGKGISEAFLPFVFDRFRQADSSSTRAEGGLGLGLAIVRHLVELHGGTVHADSLGLGQGAKFMITLPLMNVATETVSPQARLDSPAIDSGNDGGTPSSSDHAVPSSAQPTPQAKNSGLALPRAASGSDSLDLLSGLHILVVDDEPDTRDFLQAAMSHYGAIVTVAASAAEALSLLTQPLDAAPASWKPDALVSDIGMPDEDGYTFIRKVRSLDAAQGTFLPALALTAYATDDDRQQALTSGFQMHLAKPIDPAAIAQAVLALVNRTAT